MERNGKKEDGLTEKAKSSDGSTFLEKLGDTAFALCFATLARIVMIFIACICGAKLLVWMAMDSILVVTNFVVGSLANSKASKTERPSCLDDPSFGEHGIASVNNTFIHYVASGKKGTAPLMIMLHGFAGSWYFWRNQIPAFNDKYYVVAIDMRGYGQSAKPSRVEDYHLNVLVEDVHQLINWLGYKQAVLVGHDWGALVAFQMSVKHHEEVTSIIALSGGSTAAMADYLVNNTKALLRSWHMFFYQLPYLPELRMRMRSFLGIEELLKEEIGVDTASISVDDKAVLKYTFSQKDAWKYPMYYYRAIFSFWSIYAFVMEFREEKRKRKRLGEIPTKTMVCWGNADKVLDCCLLSKTRDLCNEDSLSEEINTGPHWIHMCQAEKVIKKMKGFLFADD
jgi:pimeloyl-ACP methyl ester carboxylesterase